MESHVYTVISKAFEKVSERALQKAAQSASQKAFPTAIAVTPRQQAMVDAYQPFLAVDHDVMWLLPRFYAQMPEGWQNLGVAFYLRMNDFKALRSEIKVRLTDHEKLPDRSEGEISYTKVCRAKLWIESTSKSGQKPEPITLIYSANSRPRTSVPIHIGINFFEASEAPLPFSLTEMEKLELMMYAAIRNKEAQPMPQRPLSRIQRVGLRALRLHMEAAEAKERALPGKTDGAAQHS
ncbi:MULTISPECIES: hypothetical protein [unclassified Duganella]|uniref:hypothetical protein n=1 Tax=unclassified Duganella TaxID=2636909 RepID=UPI0006F969B5|nr:MULTISPECIES: hypothetical protein [unclassified Duganella]KQV54057.1 hypothetical protein ASD07_05825 [Duganella sp. Root336D2]